MKNTPIWFTVVSMMVIVLAIATLITSSRLLRIATMLGLAIIMTALGSFEWKKQHKIAYLFFIVAACQVLILIDGVYFLYLR
ncbi:hypothetical protein ACFVS2_05660 [Brevibacillus sp. NPDC058079]|uniref:hypothetical protein n=1 Tax=Brevibacillus sp. NPDC058079 TaxID=3346330 RepID=UPI0036F02287